MALNMRMQAGLIQSTRCPSSSRTRSRYRLLNIFLYKLKALSLENYLHKCLVLRNIKLLILNTTLNRFKYMMGKGNTITLEKLCADYPMLQEQVGSGDLTWQKALLQKVDETDFSLVDWVDSLNILYQWLEQSKLTLPFQDGLGYVSCAARSVGNNSALNHLPLLVHDFLDQYGCELAVKR